MAKPIHARKGNLWRKPIHSSAKAYAFRVSTSSVTFGDTFPPRGRLLRHVAHGFYPSRASESIQPRLTGAENAVPQ